jgi:hypothetical protein
LKHGRVRYSVAWRTAQLLRTIERSERGHLSQRIEHLFTIFDMHKFADAKIDTLSTGMRQKTVITRTLTPFSVVKVNTAPMQKMSGALIGAVLGCMIVISMIMGGIYPGTDLTAGEKERRTMEMLLSSPPGRRSSWEKFWPSSLQPSSRPYWR